MKNLNYFLSLLFLPILISSCSIANSYHFPRQEVHFFNDKGESSVAGTVDMNSYSLGLDLNGSYAFSKKGFITGGLNLYGTPSNFDIFENLGPIDENDSEDGADFNLSGISARFGLGSYQNFGRGYFEVSGAAEMGFNTLKANYPVQNLGKTQWNYNPFALECNLAIGGNKHNVGVAFALNLKYVNFGETVPYYYSDYDNSLSIHDYVKANIYVTPSFCLRAGSGPVKGLFNVGICVPATDDFGEEPIFKMSAGVAIVMGRMQEKREHKN